MKIITHIAAVEHQSGIDLYAAATEEALNAKLAAYCRSHWGTCDKRNIENADGLPDDKVIELYFDDHENDSLSRDVDSIEVDLRAVVELICQRPSVSVHLGDRAAMAAAVEFAMENIQDPDAPLAESEARAGFELTLTDYDRITEGDYEVHLLTPTNTEL